MKRRSNSKNAVKSNGNPYDDDGWAVGGKITERHYLTLSLKDPITVPADGQLVLTLEHNSKHGNHALGQFRVRASQDPRAIDAARPPQQVVAVLQTPAEQRNEAGAKTLRDYYLSIAPELAADRQKLAVAEKSLAAIAPITVPVMRELPANARRTTKVQIRGNFEALGEEVQPGTPSAFHPLAEGPRDRLALAKWLVDPRNPTMPRVIMNRYWEQIFGVDIVSTAEEFGSQGEQPFHPELLDWLASEFIQSNWNTKAMLKKMVMLSI